MCKKKKPTRHKLFQSSAVERRGCGAGGVRRRKEKNDNRRKKKRRLPFSTPCLVFSISSCLQHVWQLVRSFKAGDSFRGDCSKCCRWLGGRRGERVAKSPVSGIERWQMVDWKPDASAAEGTLCSVSCPQGENGGCPVVPAL